MATLIEFHDDNGHTVAIFDDKITLTLKPEELVIQSSLGQWSINTNIQVKYVEIRRQLRKETD